MRDSGLLRALLGAPGARELHGHPVAGSSWGCFVVEQLAAALPAAAQMGLYRTTVGAELDLVIEHRGKKVDIEIKFSVALKPARGFWQLLKDLQISTAWVVAPIPRPLSVGAGCGGPSPARAGRGHGGAGRLIHARPSSLISLPASVFACTRSSGTATASHQPAFISGPR